MYNKKFEYKYRMPFLPALASFLMKKGLVLTFKNPHFHFNKRLTHHSKYKCNNAETLASTAFECRKQIQDSCNICEGLRTSSLISSIDTIMLDFRINEM